MRGGGYKTGEGHVKFYPSEKGGGGRTVLAKRFLEYFLRGSLKF